MNKILLTWGISCHNVLWELGRRNSQPNWDDLDEDESCVLEGMVVGISSGRLSSCSVSPISQ